MSLVALPKALASAAGDLAVVRSSTVAASTAAATRTTGVVVAAGIEISVAIATLFRQGRQHRRRRRPGRRRQ
ncbi:PE domain-containing protein [Mycobacterium camsae]|uniref:PE domain-containing protein n=1 Tax=Mycobacterium gordonae TaxID=1778 RepID=UPI00198259E1